MFRVVEVTTYNDGTNTAQGMYPYADEHLAIANFHTKFGGALKQTNVETEMAMVVTEDGQILRKPNADGTFTTYTDYFQRTPPQEKIEEDV